MELEKNNRYSYTCFGHAVIPEKNGLYYCRARNSLMQDDMWLCKSCPLLGGTVSGENGELYPECWYYDLETENGFNSKSYFDLQYYEDFKKKIDGMISSGFVTDFPSYLTEEESIRNFGKIEEALIFAGKKHKGQTRKGSKEPYICHPIEVMMIVARMTDDNNVIEAAVLHDTLEDTDTRAEEIKDQFGERVLQLVLSESEDKRNGISKSETWKIRKQETIEHIRTAERDSKLILLADKLSNLRATARELGDRDHNVWARFNVKDPKEHKWYYGELLKLLDDFSDTPQYNEYKLLMKKIFE